MLISYKGSGNAMQKVNYKLIANENVLECRKIYLNGNKDIGYAIIRN